MKKKKTPITRLTVIASTILALVFGSTKGLENIFPEKKAQEQTIKRTGKSKAPVSTKKTNTKTSDAPVAQPLPDSQLEMPAINKNSGEKIISRLAYTVSYNEALRLPNWVAWHLTASHTTGSFKRKDIKFAEDESVPSPRATNADYVQSGYDRGHMCPSGDNKWSEQAQVESFFYTNCCPQRHSLNAGEWEELESRCRLWAKTYGDVYIACGPLFTGSKHKTIGKNRVAVPDAFFKVVLRMSEKPAAIGFIYKNEGDNGAMEQHVRTVDEIEQLTGFDFFAALDNKQEKKIEATANLSDWK